MTLAGRSIAPHQHFTKKISLFIGFQTLKKNASIWSGKSIPSRICREIVEFVTKTVHCHEGPVHCGSLLLDGWDSMPGRPGGRERQ